MCELFGLSSNLAVSANFSLETFARHGGDTGPHRDGWGIAYYQGKDARLIKEAEPAANSEWLEFISRHRLRSPTILSHIRKASQGRPAYANTQPFMRELGGHQHVFAHNGDLGRIEHAKALSFCHFRPIGETDSEHAFCALLERLHDLWSTASGIPPLPQRYRLVSKFAAEISPLGPANFIYADGDALFAHANRRKQSPSGKIAPPGLFHLCRRCSAEAVFQVPGLHLDSEDQHVTLIASVPLSDEDWRPFAEGEVLCLQNGRIIG